MTDAPLPSDELSFVPLHGFDLIGLELMPRSTRAPIRVVHPERAYRITFAPQGLMAAGWYQLAIRFPIDGLVEVVTQISFADKEILWLRLPAASRNDFVAHIRSSTPIRGVTLIISGSGYLLRPVSFTFERVGFGPRLLALARRLPDVTRRDGFAVFGTLAEAALRLSRSQSAVIASGATLANERAYDTWMRVFDEAPQRDRARHVERLASLKSRPVFSILTTSSGLDLQVIDRLARSLAEQFYQHWQLLVAGAQEIVGDLRQALANLLPNQSIEVYPQNSDYAATLNQLACIARGEFLIPIPSDVILRPNALLELALTLDTHPTAALIYSDEDRIGGNGERCEPSFKPAWSPDLFDVADYLGNLTAIRRDMVDAVGGWRSDLEPVSQYDLRMRVIDRVQPTNIVHLAKILVHKPSTKPNAIPRRRIERVIHDHCARQSIKAEIVWPEDGLVPRLQYRIPEPSPLVSLIISTRDRADILEMCVRSILNLTRYAPYEVLIVDNDSKEVVTHRLFTALRADRRVNVLQYPGPFNFSTLNNAAARRAKGTILGLVNNDVEIKDGAWLDEMVALAARPEIGCVGCKLLYPDKRIQHAGVYLGVGGIAGHGYRFAPGNALGYMNRLRTVQNVSAVTAACLFVRKVVYNQVGGLDEQVFRVALNDVDLCLKVRAAGYLNLWTPFVEMVHHESASRGRDYSAAKAQRLSEEVKALRQRWGEELFSDPYYSPHLTNDAEDFSYRTR
jgi:GT2 family glycosyltransferase